MTLPIKPDALGGMDMYRVGYIVADGAIQVTRHMTGYGPISWLLDFTENMPPAPEPLTMRVVHNPRGVPPGAMGGVLGAVVADRPSTLKELEATLKRAGIDDVSEHMPYIDPYGDVNPWTEPAANERLPIKVDNKRHADDCPCDGTGSAT